MELMQLWIVSINRSFEWKDVFMNFLGAIMGTFVCFVLYRTFNLKQNEEIL